MRTILHLISRGLPFAFLITIPLAIFHLIRFRHNQRTAPTKAALLRLLFLFYLAWLFGVTVIPEIRILFLRSAPFFKFHIVHRSGHTLNLIPFASILPILRGEIGVNSNEIAGFSAANILGNILMFVPLTALLPCIQKRTHSTCWYIALGFGMSAAIESIQYFTGRAADIDDVLLNTLGTAIGALVVLPLLRNKRTQ